MDSTNTPGDICPPSNVQIPVTSETQTASEHTHANLVSPDHPSGSNSKQSIGDLNTPNQFSSLHTPESRSLTDSKEPHIKDPKEGSSGQVHNNVDSGVSASLSNPTQPQSSSAPIAMSNSSIVENNPPVSSNDVDEVTLNDLTDNNVDPPTQGHQNLPTSETLLEFEGENVSHSEGAPPASEIQGSQGSLPSSNQRYWCHQCQRETPTMMAPNLICSVCHGEFVEEFAAVEEHHTSSREPSRSGRSRSSNTRTATLNQDLNNSDIPGQEISFILRSLLSQASPDSEFRSGSTQGSANHMSSGFESLFTPMAPRSNSDLSSGNQNAQNSDGATVNQSVDPSTSTSESADGSQSTDGQQAQPSNPQDGQNNFPFTRSYRSSDGNGFTIFHSHNLSRSASADPNNDANNPNVEIPLNLGGLFNLFLGGGNPENANNLFGTLFGAAGNVGDYAWGPSGLDDIITQLMEQNQGQNSPHPTPEEYIQKLQRIKVTPGVLESSKECGICMEDYNVSDTIVQLGCHHQFHEDCITKWLRVNGSCPICRIPVGESSDDQNNSMDVDDESAGANENTSSSAPPTSNPDRLSASPSVIVSDPPPNDSDRHFNSNTDEIENGEQMLPGYFPQNRPN
ncbi:putative RING finger protein [Smittium mucronatum]|uniref:Putative RING finger protein n=1 Tax=Smittium mucronatum TaxID=133383 RepID=A0A1R0H0L8_9FUNG|nr:putative RING finger protein [Smittium mucronatum]